MPERCIGARRNGGGKAKRAIPTGGALLVCHHLLLSGEASGSGGTWPLRRLDSAVRTRATEPAFSQTSLRFVRLRTCSSNLATSSRIA
eukprot:2944014-Pleurochrysis_carterae.AAC.2